MTYMQVRRFIVWQESMALRALARAGRSVTSWRSPDYWAEYQATQPGGHRTGHARAAA